MYDAATPRTEWIATVINARAAKGWTQTDLARAIGVQQPAIAKLESGDRDPRLSTMVAVCTALGIDELRIPIVEQAS
jgi:predicted transcriptional regulator